MTQDHNNIQGIEKQDIAHLVDRMNSGFLVTDQNGVVLYCNDAYRQLTKLYDLKAGEDILRYREAGAIKGEPACIAVLHERRKIIRKFVQTDDGVFIVSSSEPIIDSDGEIRLVVTRVHDMTEFIGIRDDIEKVRTIMESMSAHKEILKDYGNNIVAISEAMTNVLDMARKVAGFDISVLMTGESGVGKDVVARFIHDQSPRSKKPFIAVNCAAIPADLLETELFGYDKGTFTGQKSGGKEGLFAAARGGTIFLDEIGDMSLELQAKILRVLEARQFRPVGSSIPVTMEARVLSATNHDLKKMIEEGKFREDLYYRINVVNLKIPPLRERSEDIIPLTLFFLQKNNEKYKLNKSIHIVELQKMQSHKWPGNVRELKNTVEMMYALSPGNLLEAPMGNRPDRSYRTIQPVPFKLTATGSWLSPESGQFVPTKTKKEYEGNTPEGDEGIPSQARNRGNGMTVDVPVRVGHTTAESLESASLSSLESYMDQSEKAYLERAYQICGSTRKMAEVLGVNHSTIMRKLKKYSISAK